MYKTVIIDDEPIIRKGIKSVLNWEQLGCTICGEASDGQQGVQLIERLRPDIIITDIKMPQMDGLTMVRSIRQVVPNSRIIILTGYRDFDYAYQAIKLEAFDFILKPTRIEQLYDVVRRAVQSLKEQSSADSETERIRQLYEKNLPVIRERYLYNLLTGVTGEMIPEEGRQLGLTIGRFVLIAAECEYRQEGTDEPEESAGTLARYGVASAFEETDGVHQLKADGVHPYAAHCPASGAAGARVLLRAAAGGKAMLRVYSVACRFARRSGDGGAVRAFPRVLRSTCP